MLNTCARKARQMGKGVRSLERPMFEMLERAAGRLSLHMPGAQGRAPFGAIDPYRLDTTELPVTDDLYAPGGAIARAQELAARSAGAAHTILLHGGSTAGIHAMLLYAARRGEQVILPRNVHVSALNLCATAGLEPVFARPAYTPDGLPYTPQESYLEALEAHPHARAMLVVRPDYYGGLYWPGDAVARAHVLGMLVLCDEAHGAHLNWDAQTPNALELGADVCVQSAHKTLPALTAGAWLHAGAGADAARLTRMLRMVQTSSPAFVGLLSLDDARAWMDAHGAASLEALKRAARPFYAQAAKLGYAEGGAMRGFACDETRLVLEAPQGGFALAGQLARMGLDVEMSDERRIVCILSLMDGESRLRRLLAALEVIGPQTAQTARPLEAPPRELPERAAALGEAAFAPYEALALRAAVGRISAAHVGLYPPGTALLTAGERVTPMLAEYLSGLDPARVFGLNADGTLNCVQ